MTPEMKALLACLWTIACLWVQGLLINGLIGTWMFAPAVITGALVTGLGVFLIFTRKGKK